MHRITRTLIAAGLVAAAACADASQRATEEAVALGPTDGRDLPGTDLERVQAGDLAPDFTLLSLAGTPVTLSDFRGRQNVVLVFYRGHW
jgi:cytochrome oxidase Cu insertion factor (SCO1/SenC/PrrC family)